MFGSGELPNEPASIAAWLHEHDVEKIIGVLAWHGGAAVVAAMERTRHLEPAARGPEFFRVINTMKRTRANAGEWPETTYARWRQGG
ncbi:MAG: hypothetical protein FJ102_09705 [Deltaproteobacteria bacterium]|nr:hypothetical protein [Deltaproteobacteria bacterium]